MTADGFADRDQTTVSNFHLGVEVNQEFGLAAVFRTKSSAAEHQNHRMLALQLRKLAALRSVICQFVIGEERTGNNVGSHR
jgi:hypothetical protein